ncbi:MAG: adenylate/guanylate cyclase domain-containing protein [Rhodobacteraceae bacterium]|nr:adenylate/guanylate cyclase domain-containing protein [Paracoccaceae bacterium]
MGQAADILATLPRDKLIAALRLIDFMLGDALKMEDADNVLTAMSEHIRAAGIPLDRATSIVPLLHAEAVASARFWERGKGPRSFLFPFSEESGEGYAHSPAAEVHETGNWVDLWLPDTPDERYDIVADLKTEGYVHYLMAPVFMKSGMAGTFSFATKHTDGFSAQDLAFLRAVFPSLAACQDILATSRAMNEVMRIYVGEEPRRRILSGDVHRGEVMHIRSAILFADMRRFTDLTSGMEAEEATGLLNRYYDCLVPSIEEQGGEVLKFIGDGVLAIFRVEEETQAVCCKALEAARAGLRQVTENSLKPRFEVGIALHLGEVAYGNVGSGMRLDYTVIGRDVNLAARLAGLCGSLNKPLLISAPFRNMVKAEAVSLGKCDLKGIADPQGVFAVSLEE